MHWIGTPWFWRIYIVLLLVGVLVERELGELPNSVREIGFSTVVGINLMDAVARARARG